MKYLINEILCEKVEVEGFDYYYSKEILGDTNNEVCIFESNNGTIITISGKGYGLVKTIGQYYKIIATNNSSLDLPQVVDEAIKIHKK